jgi:hypothetical protein
MCLLLSEELLVLLRSHPTLPSPSLPPISPILSPNQIPNPQKYTNPNFKGNCNNQNNTYKKTTHTPPKKNTHTLWLYPLFCSVFNHGLLDFFSSSWWWIWKACNSNESSKVNTITYSFSFSCLCFCFYCYCYETELNFMFLLLLQSYCW